MKKIITILSIFVLGLSMASCCDCSTSKYKIRDNRGNCWYTNAYTNSGTCISFVSEHTGRVVTICGSYSILENN